MLMKTHNKYTRLAEAEFLDTYYRGSSALSGEPHLCLR